MAIKIEKQIDEAFEFLPEGFALCFTGPSGTGKTWNTERVAKKYGYHVVDPRDSKTQTSKDCVMFYDEAQMMKRAEQEKLLTQIDEGASYSWERSDDGMRIVKKHARFIFATTHLGDLIEALRTRCIEINFGYYSSEDMAIILRHNFPSLSNNLVQRLVHVSKGTPRQGVKLGKYLEQLLLQMPEEQAFQQSLRIVGVNEDGFTKNDRDYLCTLFEGTTSEKGLSQILGLDTKTIKDTIENYLMREGYVKITNRGRNLTPKGNEYVRNKLIQGS